MPLTDDEKTVIGLALGATEPDPRMIVRIDMGTHAVYSQSGEGGNRIGVMTHYTRNDGARTPTGGKFTSHRVTVRLTGDDRVWVGQIRSEEMLKKSVRKTVTLRVESSGTF